MAAPISFKRPSNTNAAASAAPTTRPTTAPSFVPTVAQATQQAAATPAPAPVQSPAPAPVQSPAPAPSADPAPAVNSSSQPTMAPAVAQPTTTALAVSDYLPPVPIGAGGVGGFEGEWTARDMAIPYLSVMQKSSPSFDEHMDWLGQWVFDKEFPLGDTIRIVVIRANKYYVEKLPYGDPKIPERFSKIEDARTAGFGPDKLVDQADLDLLIELDSAIEGIQDLASLVVGDKAYLMARYTVKSTSFKVAKVLMKDAAGWLKGNLLNGHYVLGTERKSNGDNTWHAPTIKSDGPTSAALRTEILDLFGMSQAA